MQVNVHARTSKMCAYNNRKMRQGSRGTRDVISGEQHSVETLREVQNNDFLIVRCAKWHT